MRTTNCLERLNQKIKRRTKVARIFEIGQDKYSIGSGTALAKVHYGFLVVL
ncbi:MAG: transposase [Actinomycetota bacterium]|nr:transposase [Actinomycetota bacterium]